ncbi:hypothetical protein K1719_008728 [Acacia pycnantha]|nr:hypothetical protein K1719_008728 [Acacia pycnantha]
MAEVLAIKTALKYVGLSTREIYKCSQIQLKLLIFCSGIGVITIHTELRLKKPDKLLVCRLVGGDGFILRLAGVLFCGVLRMRIAASRAVYALGSSTTKAKKEMGEFGCIAPLIQMLDGKAVEEKEAAAMALSILMLYAGNKRIF